MEKLDSKKIYIVRHGETDYNLNGIVQGSGIDADINQTGQRQRDAFFGSYNSIGFEKVFTSALKRTYQSVEHFIKLGIPHQALPGLNEISWGTKEGTSFGEEGKEYYADMISRWSSGETSYRVDGGESPEDVEKRVKSSMQQILKDDARTILICTHGRALRILMCSVLGHPLNQMDDFPHANLGLYVLNYNGKYSIERKNDTAHLSRL